VDQRLITTALPLRAGRRRTRLLAAATIAALAVHLAIAVGWDRPLAEPAPLPPQAPSSVAGGDVSVPMAPRTPASGPPRPQVDPEVRTTLYTFANHVHKQGTDPPGAFGYLRVRQDTYDPDATPTVLDGVPRRVRVTHRWRGTGDAGREVTFDATDGGCRQTDSDTSWSAGMPGWLDAPVPITPQALRLNLGVGSADQVLAGVARMFELHYTTVGLRVAVVRLLAELPGLTLTRPSRTLLAVHAVRADGIDPARNVRRTLTLNATSGHPVRYQSVPADPARVPIGARVHIDATYTWQQVTRTASTRTPVPGC
jgi:hypothetical protein